MRRCVQTLCWYCVHHIYVSIQTLYSVLCWSTFGSDNSLESSWVLGTPVFGEFLPFFSANPFNLGQVGWGESLHSYFQVYPEMFDLWLGHSRTFLHCLGCALRVVVLLESEPSPQSEVLSTLEQVFIKDLCTLLSSSLPRFWPVSQSLTLKIIPTAWCCHHHASL